jgi:tRNA (guanine-N7-)-methyltransferase
MTEGLLKSHRQGGVRYEGICGENGKKMKLEFENGIFVPARAVWEELSLAGSFAPIVLSEIFSQAEAPLNVEIGMGNGDFILHSAASGGNWLGFEPIKEFFMKAVKKIEREGLSNVRLIQFDAELFARLLPKGSVKAFYVNFPDPWPKRRHKKRRLLKSWFLELMRDKLAPDGAIVVLTDHDDYAEEIHKNFSEVTGLSSALDGGYSNEADGYYRTKYFKKFAECGKVYYFEYKLVNL